jgi:hypothetical protein
MRKFRKLMGRFEGEGVITDPRNEDVRIMVHYQYSQWQEFTGTAPPIPTFKQIDGILTCTDTSALMKLWQEQRKMELETRERTFSIFLTDPSGEFTVTG